MPDVSPGVPDTARTFFHLISYVGWRNNQRTECCRRRAYELPPTDTCGLRYDPNEDPNQRLCGDSPVSDAAAASTPGTSLDTTPTADDAELALPGPTPPQSVHDAAMAAAVRARDGWRVAEQGPLAGRPDGPECVAIAEAVLDVVWPSRPTSPDTLHDDERLVEAVIAASGGQEHLDGPTPDALTRRITITALRECLDVRRRGALAVDDEAARTTPPAEPRRFHCGCGRALPCRHCPDPSAPPTTED